MEPWLCIAVFLLVRERRHKEENKATKVPFSGVKNGSGKFIYFLGKRDFFLIVVFLNSESVGVYVFYFGFNRFR